MSTPVRFRVLGPVSAARGGESLPLGAPRQCVVLAVLLLSAGHRASAANLVEAVWGSDPPRTALASLRNSVSRLRAVLGEDVVVGGDGGYALRVEDFDLAEAERLVGTSRGMADPVRRHAALVAAGRLWTGEPLAGLDGPFVRFQRSRLNDLRLTITEHRLSLEVESHGGREVIDQLTRLCRRHPFREEPHRLLMLALHRSHRDDEALAVYDALGLRLAESLGIDPSAAVTAVRDRIRDTTVVVPVPAQLPAAVGAFTGRDRLVGRLTTVLTAGLPPVAALSGFGGIGKTAVAVHVAHRLRHRFGDGQLFADLRGGEVDPVAPGVVLARFLRALGVPDAEIPDDTARRAALFASVTVGKRVFMLLDNAFDADQVRPLLAAGRHGSVLVTGRSRLTELERVSLFDVDVLDEAEAFTLFRRIVGAERVESEDVAATAVVAACGHLPLAVRIAASRALSRPRWPLSYLAERLEDTNHRLDELRDDDRSVAAAFALSYEHLDPGLAEGFRSLAVVEVPDFSDTEAAKLLRRPRSEVAADLARLVTLGLLGNPAPDRYQFHDLVRLYGSRRASAAERRAVIERLVDHLLTITVAAIGTAYPAKHRDLRPTGVPVDTAVFDDRGAAVDWLSGNTSRILSALRQTARCHPGALGPASDLSYAIGYWAGTGSHRQNFIDTVTELAETARRHDDPTAESRARLAALQCLALWRPHRAEPQGRRLLLLVERCGDDLQRAEIYAALADALTNTGTANQTERVLRYRSLAIEYFERAPDGRGRAALEHCARALTLAATGHVAAALTEAAEAVTVLRGFGNDGDLVIGLFLHGLVLCRAGRFDIASHRFAESRDLANDLQDRPLKMLSLYNLARVHAADGDSDILALVYAVQAAALSSELADDDKRARSLVILGQCLQRAGSLRRSRTVLTEALRIFERLDRPDAAEQQRLLLDLLSRDPAEPEPA